MRFVRVRPKVTLIDEQDFWSALCPERALARGVRSQPMTPAARAREIVVLPAPRAANACIGHYHYICSPPLAMPLRRCVDSEGRMEVVFYPLPAASGPVAHEIPRSAMT